MNFLQQQSDKLPMVFNFIFFSSWDHSRLRWLRHQLRQGRAGGAAVRQSNSGRIYQGGKLSEGAVFQILNSWWNNSLWFCMLWYHDGTIGTNVDGNLTLGENLADHGGLSMALEAYLHWREHNSDVRLPAIPFDDMQLFFLGKAYILPFVGQLS